MLGKCLFTHVCPQSHAKHYGKGPQRIRWSMRPRCQQGAHGRVVSESSQPEVSIFLFLVKGWCRRKTLLNTCHPFSWLTRKWTIMIMTFRLILSSRSSPSLAPSPDLFPMEETLQYKPTVGAASSISSLIGFRKLSSSKDQRALESQVMESWWQWI